MPRVKSRRRSPSVDQMPGGGLHPDDHLCPGTRPACAKLGPAPSNSPALPDAPEIGAARRAHIAPVAAVRETPEGWRRVTVDADESPLAWLARRAGRNGRPLIDAAQFQAGERLRAEFTRAQMMPRLTADWSATGGRGRGAGSPETYSDQVTAARQRLAAALDAVGPEFSGLLVDVCCFLKRLEEAERERGWPVRSAKIVLALALERLARHYGLRADARSRGLRAWSLPTGTAVEEPPA